MQLRSYVFSFPYKRIRPFFDRSCRLRDQLLCDASQAAGAEWKNPLGCEDRKAFGVLTMVRQVIFHIGCPKTGTTSIQKWLYDSRLSLRENHATVYPEAYAGLAKTHSKLRLRGRKSIQGKYVQFRDEIRKKEYDVKLMSRKILSEAEGAETLIFSNENWTQFPIRKARVKKLLRYLGATEVKVICYVREHVDYMQSMWREWIHYLPYFQETFSNYSTNFLNMKNPLIDNIFSWKKIGSLNLRWLDRKSLCNGCVVEDFCRNAGISGAIPEIKDENPSIGGNLLLFKLARNLILHNPATSRIPPSPSLARMPQHLRLYNDLKKIALKTSKFRSPLFISDSSAEKIRKMSKYNEILFSEIGEPHLRSWSSEAKIPDLENLHNDLQHIFQELRESPDARLYQKMLSIPCSYFELDLN